MGAIDYKNLDFDTKIGRKARVCGRCGKFMAVTTECPVRSKRENQYVCWHCCNYKCAYSVDTPLGKRCGVKMNIRKKETERRRAERKEQKELRQQDKEAENSFFDMEE